MLHPLRFGLVALAIVGCKDGGGEGDDDDDDGVPSTTAPEPSSTLALVDAWNVAYTATPDIPVFSVAPGADFPIDFGGVTTDVWGRPVDPAAFNTVLLSELATGLEEAAASIALRGPTPNDAVETWGLLAQGATSVPATALSHTGHAFPAENTEAGQAFLVTLTDADQKMISVALVSVSGGADPVTLGDARITSSLTLDPDGPVTTAALGPWTLDWSALTVTPWGDPLDPLVLDTMFLTRWDSPESVDLLEPDRAPGYWAKYVPGSTSVDPQIVNGLDGEPFPGFEAGPTWVVGFRCVNCATPVPLYATRIVVLP